MFDGASVVEPRRAFSERDNCLHLALALTAWSTRLDAWLVHGAVPAPPTAADDPILLAALGLVALRERWMALVAAFAPPPPDRPTKAPTPPLRDLGR